MVAAITQKNQEVKFYPPHEEVGIYKRLENIIKNARVQSLAQDELSSIDLSVKKNIAQQVHEQKDKAISRSLLLFGTIHL